MREIEQIMDACGCEEPLCLANNRCMVDDISEDSDEDLDDFAFEAPE